MITRGSTRAGSLLARLRSILKGAREYPVDRPLNLQETDWEPEDHLKAPAADPRFVDPWDADAVSIGATESQGSRNRPNVQQNSPSRRDGGSADEERACIPGPIFERTPQPTVQNALSLSAPASEGQGQPVLEPPVPIGAAGSPQNGACSSGTELKRPEQLIFDLQTRRQAQRSLKVPSSQDHEPGIRRTDIKPDPTGTAADRVVSDGATRIGISDAFENEELEFAETIDADPPDHETFLGADLADDHFYYDRDAHQLPWGKTHAGEAVYDDAVRRAREKAASITSIVEVTSRREQEDLFDWLTELFLRLKHPTTFQAIKRIALQGITADLLQRVVALREYWMERREWWPGRYERSSEVRPLRRGSGGLTWAVAVRVCRTRADYAPEDMIDENWFDEWLNLAPGIPGDPREIAAYHRFAAYVDAKVTGPDPELLNYGLTRLDQSDGREEMGEDRGWWRTLPRYEEDIRFGFNVLTPFRDGFGAAGYPEYQEPFRGAQSES